MITRMIENPNHIQIQSSFWEHCFLQFHKSLLQILMHDKYYQVQSKTKRKIKEKAHDTNTFKIDLEIT